LCGNGFIARPTSKQERTEQVIPLTRPAEPPTAQADHTASAPAPAPAPASIRQFFARSGLPGTVAIASTATFLASFALAAWRPANGFNITDESFYLLAVDPGHHGDAFNGLWGFYARLMWQVAGWNVGSVRLLGLAILVLTACALGYRLAPAIAFPRITTIAVCASGAVAYYSLGLRTPSYNWLAVEGVAIAATALLPNGYVFRKRDAALAAAGVFVAGMGKPTTGIICLVVVASLSLGPWVTIRRLPIAIAFGSTMVGLLATHFVAILSPQETFTVLTKSAATMTSVDPEHYSLGGSIAFMAGNTVDLLKTHATAGGALIGFLPILAFLAKSRRREWFTAWGGIAILSATIYSIERGSWGGGGPGWGGETGGIAILATTMCLVIASAAALRIVEAPGQIVRLGVLFGGATLATAWGSNTGLGFVLNFASLLVIGLTLVLSSSFEPPTARTLKQVLSVASCCAILVMSIQGVRKPFFMEGRSDSTHPISFGRIVVYLGPDTVERLEVLSKEARKAGWMDGTKLVDTTFTPGIGLALNSEVPHSLLPAFPGYPLSSICTTLQPLASWQDSWILVRRDMNLQDREFLAAVLGRQYPEGYARASQWSMARRDAELWKPVGAAVESPSTACAGIG